MKIFIYIFIKKIYYLDKVDFFGISKFYEENDQDIENNSLEIENTQKTVINIPESIPDVWNWKKAKYQERYSSLTTYRCWKCRKTGHLSEGNLLK